MRGFIERVFRNSAFKRRLPNGLPIWVSADSQLKYLRFSGFDADLTRLAQDNTNSRSIVWDIGANCGVFTFSTASAKSVVAVEADPFLCHLLQKSVLTNGLTNTTVFPVAISDTVGSSEFAIAERGRASNHLVEYGGRSQSGGSRGTLRVPTTTLDVMLDSFPHPTFVKIDVEGAELAVLRGATRLLSTVKPTIYIEVSGEHSAECKAILERAGYEVSGDFNWLAIPD